MTTQDFPAPRADQEPVTMKTVAERAGLHTSTVSRALRRPADSDATAAKVHAAAAEVGYRPDFTAASLRTRRSMTIGMVVHALTDVVQAIMYEEIEREVDPMGYQVLIANTHDKPHEQRDRIELMLSRKVDGLIVADSHLDSAYADWVASLGVPYVLVMRRAGKHPAITGDDKMGGRMAADHLADLGHRKIAVLRGPEYSSASVDRALGFSQALSERSIELDRALQESSLLFSRNGYEAMNKILSRTRDFTALFAVNDFAALGAIQALREADLEPGKDVAVVGYNDLSIAASVGLTSVKSSQQDMGKFAARALLGAMNGDTPKSLVLPTSLVVRSTSCPTPNGK